MGLNHSPSIVTSGLVLALDAANPKSYLGSGTSWNDLSTNQNNFTVGGLGTVTFDTSNTKSFLCTNGVNKRITSSGDSLDLQSQLTISAWIKPTGTAFTTSQYYYVIGKNSSAGYGDHQFAMNINPSQNFEMQLSGSTLSIPYTWTTDTWYHLVTKWDGSNLFGYINGILQGSVGGATSTTFKPNFSISGRSTLVDFSGSAYSFPGYISIVSVYNRALSADEITQNFNALKGRYGL